MAARIFTATSQRRISSGAFFDVPTNFCSCPPPLPFSRYDEEARKAFGDKAKLNFPEEGELAHFDGDLAFGGASAAEKAASGHQTASDKATENRKRARAAKAATEDDIEDEGDEGERKRYGTSADKWLFNLDSGGALDLLDDYGDEAHRTRHARFRRPAEPDAASKGEKVNRPLASSPGASGSAVGEAGGSPAPSRAKTAGGSGGKSKGSNSGGGGKARLVKGKEGAKALLREAEMLVGKLGERPLDDIELCAFDAIVGSGNRQVLEAAREGLLRQLSMVRREVKTAGGDLGDLSAPELERLSEPHFLGGVADEDDMDETSEWLMVRPCIFFLKSTDSSLWRRTPS